MKRLLLVCWMLCLFAAGCRGTQTASPTPIPMSAAIAGNNTVIQWVRSPETIVFRADVAGGSRAASFESKRDVPLCTLYGDGRVVWVNTLGVFNIQILYDRLQDTDIANFVAYLTVNERIYTYNSTPAASDGEDPNAVVEMIDLNVNGTDHYADAFSGWDDAWFDRVLTACRSLSQSPVLFEPTGAWLSVVPATYDPQSPVLDWAPAATGLDLAALASDGAAVWLTNSSSSLIPMWRTQLSQPSRYMYKQGDLYFSTALQVPGISRTSPPAPAS